LSTQKKNRLKAFGRPKRVAVAGHKLATRISLWTAKSSGRIFRDYPIKGERLPVIQIGFEFRHPLKGDCQQKTPIHRKMESFFAGLPQRFQRLPLPYPHPVFLFDVDLQPGTHQDQGR